MTPGKAFEAYCEAFAAGDGAAMARAEIDAYRKAGRQASMANAA